MSYSDFFRQQLDGYIRDFESALLEWLRDENDTVALMRIEHTLTHLSAMDRREAYRRLWWLGSGMAEAMRYRAIDSTPLVRHLFAVVLTELRAQRSGAGGDGAERPRAPNADIFDDIITALKAPTTPELGPIMQNISREFSLHPPAT